jgi:hypothetical protein
MTHLAGIIRDHKWLKDYTLHDNKGPEPSTLKEWIKSKEAKNSLIEEWVIQILRW